MGDDYIAQQAIIDQSLVRLWNLDERISNPLIDLDRTIYTAMQDTIFQPLTHLILSSPQPTSLTRDASFILILLARRTQEVEYFLQNPDVRSREYIHPFQDDQIHTMIRMLTESIAISGRRLQLLPRDRQTIEENAERLHIPLDLFQFVFRNQFLTPPRAPPPRDPPAIVTRFNANIPGPASGPVANRPARRRLGPLPPLEIPVFDPNNVIGGNNANVPADFWEPVRLPLPRNSRVPFEPRQGSATEEYYCGLCSEDHRVSENPHVRASGCNHAFCNEHFNMWDQHLYDEYRRLFCPMCRNPLDRQAEPRRH